VRVIESDEDVLLYDVGHIPGAQKVDWHQDLNDHVVRDYVSREQFQALVRRLGIDESTTVVFYGDKNNWWATYAFWVFQLFGFANARILDGGRTKWEQEGRPMTEEVPTYPPTRYTAPERADERIRAFMDDVRRHLTTGGTLIDVRTAPEFTGERTHMPDYPQEGHAARRAHPGARNVPWARAAQPDGTFSRPTSCAPSTRARRGSGRRRRGRLLPHRRAVEPHLVRAHLPARLRGVRNYDGSWTEWGNAVRAPIARSSRRRAAGGPVPAPRRGHRGPNGPSRPARRAAACVAGEHRFDAGRPADPRSASTPRARRGRAPWTRC
jgi:thiosulfate/3-mercaptopyruvate sulfurtransferase